MSKSENNSSSSSVFISYSRKDKTFVQKLHNSLVESGLSTWVDWEGIPLTADWWQEIKQAIENADAFVFVISPDSLTSKVCADEIQAAVDNNKRLVPILHRDPEKGDPIHPKISAHNWVFIRDEKELETNVPDMVRTIHTDLDWVKAHTRLLRRAIEWENNGRNNSFLLRGDDLKRAENWLERASGKEPAPTELQTRYIADSRSDAKRRTRLLAVGLGVSLVITFLAIFSFLASVEANNQRNRANVARATAVGNEQEAIVQKEIAVSARATAEAAANEAEEQRTVAEEQRTVAEEQRDIAVAAEAEADNQREIAEEQRDIAVAAEAEAARQRDRANALKEEALALKTAITGELLAQQDKYTLSTLVALQSYQQQPTVEGEQLLRSLLARLPAAQFHLMHEDWVNKVVFSPDGSRLLTASDDGTAVVWDVASGESLFTFPHDGLVLTAAFNPDASLIATGDGQSLEDGSYAGVVKIWDAASGELIREIQHEDWINDVEFSPDGRYLAYGVYDGTVRVIHPESGIVSFGTNQSAPIWDVTYSPDGSIFVSSDDNGRAWVWDAANADVLVTLSHDAAVYGATFSPNGARLATYSDDGTARVWNRFNWIKVATVFHEDWVVDAAFSPDSRLLATASADGTGGIWDPNTGKELFDLEHQAYVNDVAFSPNGKWLVTSSDDNTAILWDVTTGQKISNMIHEAPVYTADFSPDGILLATADLDGMIEMWDVTKDTAEVSRAAHADQINDLALTPDGAYLVTTNRDGLHVWEIDALIAGDLATAQEAQSIATEQPLLNLAVAPDNETVATASQNGGVIVWHWPSGESRFVLGEDQNINALAISPDGTRLVTAGTVASMGGDRLITVWDTTTGEPVFDPIVPDALTLDISFTPDGEQFVTATGNGLAQFYQTETGDEGQQFQHNEAVNALAFSPDGHYLATGSADNAARIWDLETGDLVTTLFHNKSVQSLTFTPDNTFLLTGSENGNLRFWDLETGYELGRIHQGEALTALTMHPNGRYIFTTNDVLAIMWDFEAVQFLHPHELEAEACSRLIRNLTRREWDQYIAFSEDAESETQIYHPICPALPFEEE